MRHLIPSSGTLKQALELQFPVSSCLFDIPTHTPQGFLPQKRLFIATLPELAAPPTILASVSGTTIYSLAQNKTLVVLEALHSFTTPTHFNMKSCRFYPQLYSKYRFSFSSLIQTITISHLYCDKNSTYVSILSPHSFFLMK